MRELKTMVAMTFQLAALAWAVAWIGLAVAGLWAGFPGMAVVYLLAAIPGAAFYTAIARYLRLAEQQRQLDRFQ